MHQKVSTQIVVAIARIVHGAGGSFVQSFNKKI
jgi:hypothetical protein